MEFYEEILLQWLKTHYGHSGHAAATEIIESVSYHALKRIKAIIEDDSLDDPDCFAKIEQIVRVFEDIGSDGGFRHDFG